MGNHPKGLPFSDLIINDLQIILINDLAVYMNQEVTDAVRRAVCFSKQFMEFVVLLCVV